jgi:hypothetical protein
MANLAGMMQTEEKEVDVEKSATPQSQCTRDSLIPWSFGRAILLPGRPLPSEVRLTWLREGLHQAMLLLQELGR